MKPKKSNHLFFPVCILVGSMAVPFVQAASDSWNVDAAGNWITFGSWLSGIQAPGSTTLDNTDIATFSNTLTGSRAVTVDANRYIGGLLFGNTSTFGYTLGTGILHLNSGGMIQTLATNGNHTDAISSAVVISGTAAATATITAGATSGASLLSISGAITSLATASNTTLLTLNGTNTGVNTVSGIIGNGSGGGALGLTKAGTGTWVLSGVNTFTGQLTVEDGILKVASVNNASTNGVLGNSASSVILGNTGSITGTLEYTAASTASSKKFTMASGGIGAFQVDTLTTNLALSGVIDGSGVLTKTGLGTLSLSGVNTYSGGTNINAGALSFLNLAAKTGTVNVAAGATLGLGLGSGSFTTSDVDNLFTGTFTGNVANVSMAVTSLVGIDTTAASLTYSSSVASTALGLNKLGANTLTLSGTNAYTGATVISAGVLQFANTASLYNSNTASWTAANIKVLSGATLALNVGGGSEFTTGNVTTLLTNLGGANGTSTNGFAAGAKIAFDTSNAVGGIFTVSNVIANSSGSGGGAVGVTKLGTNTLVLSGNNSYSGGTTVSGGTLTLSGANTGNGATTVNGGTLNLANTLALQNSTVTMTGAGALTFDSAVGANTFTLGGLNATTGGVGYNVALQNTAAAAVAVTLKSGNYYGVLSGAGSVVIAGNVTLVAASNTYTGSTTINSGSTLNLGSFSSGFSAATLSPSSAIINNGTLAFVDTSRVMQQGTDFANAISGTGSLFLQKATTTVVLNGANTYSGGTSLGTNNDTRLFFNHDLSLGTGTISTTAGTSYLGSVDTTAHTLANNFILGGSTRFGKGGSASGGIGDLILNGAINLNAGASIEVWDTTTTTFNGVVSNGGISKGNTGTLKLAGANTYLGVNTVSAGTLQFAKTASLYNNTVASWTAANLKVASAATLAFNVGGTGEFTTGNMTTVLTNLGGLGGAPGSGLGLQAGSKIGFDTTNSSGGTFVLSDNLANSTGTGGGSIGVTKLGTNTLVLSGTNSNSGGTIVNAGTLQFAKTVALYNNTSASWTAANINVKSGATLAMNVDSAGTAGFTSANLNTLVTNISVAASATAGLQAGATLGLDTGTATGGTFTQGNLIANSTGANGGTIGLTKLGVGTLVLDKANTYSGATTVSAGTLLINGASTGTGLVSVALGATVGGTQSTAAAMNITGSLSPGASIESLISGALTMNAGSTFVYESANNTATGADLMVVNGTLSLTGVNLSVDSANLGLNTWAINDKLTLISYKNAAITSGFNGYTDDTTYSFGSNQWLLNYDDTSKGLNFGGDTTGTSFVTFTMVPEPSAAMLVGGLGLLAMFRRRRND